MLALYIRIWYNVIVQQERNKLCNHLTPHQSPQSSPHQCHRYRPQHFSSQLSLKLDWRSLRECLWKGCRQNLGFQFRLFGMPSWSTMELESPSRRAAPAALRFIRIIWSVDKIRRINHNFVPMKGRLRAAFFCLDHRNANKKRQLSLASIRPALQFPFKGLSWVIIAPTALPFISEKLIYTAAQHLESYSFKLNAAPAASRKNHSWAVMLPKYSAPLSWTYAQHSGHTFHRHSMSVFQGRFHSKKD